ncbi:MAG TPA: DUF1476 domain-containing protein [Xanthobacteraceae bacterium]
MGAFDQREKGFENQFAHEEELKFRATARRNSLLGLWAAGKLGLFGQKAEAYAKALVASDVEASGAFDVFGKIRRDFEAKGLHLSDREIRRTMTDFMTQAIAEIRTTP